MRVGGPGAAAGHCEDLAYPVKDGEPLWSQQTSGQAAPSHWASAPSLLSRWSRPQVVPLGTEGSPGPSWAMRPSMRGLTVPDPTGQICPLSLSLSGAPAHPHCLLQAGKPPGKSSGSSWGTQTPPAQIGSFPASHHPIPCRRKGRTGGVRGWVAGGGHGSQAPAAPTREGYRLPAPGRTSHPCWNGTNLMASARGSPSQGCECVN